MHVCCTHGQFSISCVEKHNSIDPQIIQRALFKSFIPLPILSLINVQVKERSKINSPVFPFSLYSQFIMSILQTKLKWSLATNGRKIGSSDRGMKSEYQ